MRATILALALCLLTGEGWAQGGYAYDFNDYNAVCAILGEAGPTHEERLAIAHAIRNRNTLHGVYGHLKGATGTQFQKGMRVWVESESEPDPTLGAKNWLSDYDLKNCNPEQTAFRWWMKETAYIGHTHFYREV